MPLVSARIVARVVPDAISGIAFAGPDQSVLCASIVQLQGSIVGDDPANHTFEWEQTDGTPVILINANTLTPSFVNPQLSDLVFTLYVDRNTPYEDSDTITVSRAPQGKVTVPGGSEGMQGRTGTGVALTTSSSANVRGSNTELLVTDPFVTGWGWENPPSARYSPIFKADDLQRIRNNLTGQYWLMNDIDLTGYDWEPIGTPQRPFRGELQGNGYEIQNLSITQASSAVNATSLDPLYSNTVAILTFNQSVDGSLATYNEVADLSPSQHNITYGPVAYADDGTLESPALYGTYLLCDGNGNRWVDLDASTDFDFGTGDFCIEFWYRHAAYNLVSGLMSAGSQFAGWAIHQRRSTESYGMNLYADGVTLISRNMLGVITLGQWSHVAFTREGTNLRLFVDGVQQGATVTDSTNITSNSSNFTVGNATPTHNVSSYSDLDEVRITKGNARYTTNFTPPQYTYDATVGSSAGLFSYIGNGALIEKLGITDASIDITGIDNTPYKGILAGTAQGPLTNDGGTVTIRDVYVEGTIASGGNQAGGLIGHTGANASSVYENTYSDVTITGGGTSVGGWAGYFDTTATYINNYWNSTKTASGVGTDGDSPIAGELDARTSAQLNAQANYTNWDFTTTWEIDEGVSPATLQQETTHIRSGGFCDDQYMIAWDIPSNVGSRLYPPTYYYKGAIVEERLSTGGWGYPRFIPRERIGALMTPDTSHRITAIWQYYPHTDSVKLRTEINRESQPTMSKEVAVLDHRLFTSKNTSSWFGPYGIDAYATGGGSEGMTTNLVINIQNPRKITLLVNSPSAYAGGTGAFTEVESAYYIRRLSGRAEAFTEPAAAYGGGTFANVVTSTITITRANGASIGGGP